MDAAKTDNMFDFINELPLGFKTKIGGNGMLGKSSAYL
jgi:ABC-type multidrug transport system fused ATPase/permease subunit